MTTILSHRIAGRAACILVVVLWACSGGSSSVVVDGAVTDGPKPVTDGPKLVTDGPKPVTDGPKPVTDGPKPVTDGPKPDSDPNQQLCACLAQQPKTSYCNKQPVTCQVPSDCCWSQSPIPCGVYGNKYTCAAGVCARAGCTTKSECVAYAQVVQQPNAQDYTCQPAPCPGQPSYCAPAVKSCTVASDCCTAGQTPCGVYTNHYSCDGGKCRYTGCASGGECVSYAQSLGLPDAASYVCQAQACYGTGYCTPKPKPCIQPSDCCLTSSVPCGVYSNRYRCEAGGCVLDGCTGKADCTSYAGALQLPDASQYNCVVY